MIPNHRLRFHKDGQAYKVDSDIVVYSEDYYGKIIISFSDNCICHFNIKILNLFDLDCN